MQCEGCNPCCTHRLCHMTVGVFVRGVLLDGGSSMMTAWVDGRSSVLRCPSNHKTQEFLCICITLMNLSTPCGLGAKPHGRLGAETHTPKPPQLLLPSGCCGAASSAGQGSQHPTHNRHCTAPRQRAGHVTLVRGVYVCESHNMSLRHIMRHSDGVWWNGTGIQECVCVSCTCYLLES